MTLSLVEMAKAKEQYIELDTQPNIVQSMVSIERSMQNAVERLRSIKTNKAVKTMLIEEIMIKTNMLVEEARKNGIDFFQRQDYIAKHSEYNSDIKLNAIRILIEEERESI